MQFGGKKIKKDPRETWPATFMVNLLISSNIRNLLTLTAFCSKALHLYFIRLRQAVTEAENDGRITE